MLLFGGCWPFIKIDGKFCDVTLVFLTKDFYITLIAKNPRERDDIFNIKKKII